ncbi:MAG: GAF domain-containing sensor histidine kinase [Gracilimonas sp.]|nr:GAF domain-containing sensor histidine kinase [Gracilimonas sp.]
METNVLNPVPKKEYQRLLELTDLNLDYSNLQEQFSDLTKLAAKVAGVEMSLINLIDSFTQWSVANHGLPVHQMPREESVCQYTIMGDEPLEVEDLRKDERFKDKDYVINDPALRYYFGIPLKTPNGHNLGALCVLDKMERELTAEKVEMLKIIADEVIDRLTSIRELSLLKQKLDEEVESKKKLSHDIRGPLGGIIGLAQIIEQQGKDNNIKDILELAEMIQKGGTSLLELADEILSEHKEKNNERVPKSYEFTLNTFKDKLLQLYTPQATSKDIDLTIVNESKNAGIPFSKNKVLQILGNLISNAIKFTPKGGMVMVRQEFIKDEEQNFLNFVVKDTGDGISEDKVREIMNGQAKSTNGTNGEKGYGFGLSLVMHLVEKMDGTIKITSQKGDGCKFDISLPIH